MTTIHETIAVAPGYIIRRHEVRDCHGVPHLVTELVKLEGDVVLAELAWCTGDILPAARRIIERYERTQERLTDE